MDKMALYEIERAIQKAKARGQKKPIVCRLCMNEMEQTPEYAVCWQCRDIYLLKRRVEYRRW